MPLTGSLYEVGNDSSDTLKGPDPVNETVEETVDTTVDAPTDTAPQETDFDHIDPNSLSPELKAIYKSMQAGLTKKMQALSADPSVAEAKQKAALYDEAVKLALAKNGGQEEQPQRAQYEWDDADLNAFDEPTVKGMSKAASTVIDRRLGPTLQKLAHYEPIIQQLEQLLPKLVESFQQTEYSAVEKDYSNADKFRDQALAYQKRFQGMSYKEALFAVAGPDLKAPTRDSAQPNNPQVDKRQASNRFPNATSSVNGRPGAQKQSLLAQVSAVLDEQRRRGR